MKRCFLSALDSATVALSDKIDETEKKVTSVLRHELKAADEVLRGEVDKLHQKIDNINTGASSAVVMERLEEMGKKMEEVKSGAPSAAVMERLNEMSKKIDARDWITVRALAGGCLKFFSFCCLVVETHVVSDASGVDVRCGVQDAWNNPANINLRQIIAWALRTSLDTRNELGLTPLINFMFFPGRDHTEDNHLTVINKALIRMLLLHQDKFIPSLQRGIQSQTEKTITPVFKCVPIEPVDANRISGTFPIQPFKQANGNCWVFRTKDLVRMMREELSYIKLDQVMLPDSANLQVESLVDVDGSMKIEKGGGIDNLKKARAVKIRQLVGLSIPALHDFAVERIRSEDPDELLAYLAVRRYWNMPASSEYLEQVCGQSCLVFSLSLSFSLFLSLSVSLCLSLSISVSLCLSLSISFYLFLSLSVSLCLSRSRFLYLHLLLFVFGWAQDEIKMGINMVRRDVLGLADTIPEEGSYHLSVDWQIIETGDAPESFVDMMGEVLGLASGDAFVQKFKEYCQNQNGEDEDAADPELTENEAEHHEDDDGACEEEAKAEASSGKKKGQKRAASSKKKKAASKKARQAKGGKAPRSAVVGASAAAAAAVFSEPEEEEEDGEEEKDLDAAVEQVQAEVEAFDQQAEPAAAASSDAPSRNLRRRHDDDAVEMDD